MSEAGSRSEDAQRARRQLESLVSELRRENEQLREELQHRSAPQPSSPIDNRTEESEKYASDSHAALSGTSEGFALSSELPLASSGSSPRRAFNLVRQALVECQQLNLANQRCVDLIVFEFLTFFFPSNLL